MGYITEAFITSSSRLIVPVIGIDHVAVNDGKPVNSPRNYAISC
jgi:branched-subunit amino acid aminotransferase/4-amino-4-deoxychorismate lyase